MAGSGGRGDAGNGPVEGMVGRARAQRVDTTAARVPVDMRATPVADGIHRLSASAPGAWAVEIVLPCGLQEHFVGGGEQFTQLDKRGRVLDGWVGQSLNAGLAFHGLDGGYKVGPYFYASSGYAAFIETSRRYRMEFAVRRPDEVVLRVPGEEINVVVIDGPPIRAVRVLTELTGRPPLAPPWAYGVWKAIRGGDDLVRAEAGRMRSESVPASAIWLDAHYQPETNSGFPAAGSYPLGEYPDIAATVEALHDLGFRVLSYVNPYLYRGTPAHDEAVARGFAVPEASGGPAYATSLHPFEGDAYGMAEATGVHSLEDGAAVVDFTNPDAVAWWQGLLRRILLEEGFDGWMQDFGDGVPPGVRLHDGSTEAESHNRYPIQYHRAALAEIRRTKPDALFFARPGYLGAQAHAPVFWPGDQTRDWSREAGIGALPPSGISLGLMGVAAWGPDIAAVVGLSDQHPLGGGTQDRELWMRFCQLGAMSPVMREHLGFYDETPVDVWTDEDTIDCWRRCAAWHLALFPYLYTCAHEASATGVPIMRGLMLDAPDHPEAWTLPDEYLLGPDLLCAPVLEKGARTRRMWLPPGGWLDIWTDARYEGPGWIEVEAPPERWPALQRADGVVAMLADVPLDLNDPRYAEGGFALEVRAVPGEAERTLFDGTTIRVRGEAVEVASARSRRYTTATPAGVRIDEAEGTDVRLRLA